MTVASPARRRPRSGCAGMLRVGADVAPPLAAYYGCRLAGTTEHLALVAAAALSGVGLVAGAVRSRRVDVVSGYLLVGFSFGLVVALVAADPRMTLTGNTAADGLSGALCLLGAAVGLPPTRLIAARYGAAGGDPGTGTETDGDRLHVRLSAMWGFGLLAEVAASLVVIWGWPVDLATAASTLLSAAAFGALLLASFLMVRADRRRHSDRTCPDPGSP